jgi:hypothetical protein
MVAWGLETRNHPMPLDSRRPQKEVPMNIPRSLLSVVLAAAFSVTLLAQQAPTGYHSVACIKVKPENASEYRTWAAEDSHKFAQAMVDSGAVTTWFRLRSVIPQGTSAECDYLIISIYPGAPPKPLDIDEMGAVLKKAGMTVSAKEFVDRRSSLTQLVSNNIFQNKILVGAAKKGDYFMVNEMKVSNMNDYLAFEKKVWQPLAEAMAKDGVRTGWSLNVRVLPRGSDLKYQAVTVDIFPSWDAVYKNLPFADTFKRVHPDMELGTTFETAEKLRTIVSANLYHVDDMVSSTK